MVIALAGGHTPARKAAEPTLVFVTSTGQRITDTEGATGDLDVGEHVRVLNDSRDPRDYIVDANARQDADSYLVDAAIAAPLLALTAVRPLRTVHQVAAATQRRRVDLPRRASVHLVAADQLTARSGDGSGAVAPERCRPTPAPASPPGVAPTVAG